MNPLIVLKLLDLAMLGFTAYENYQEQRSQNDLISEELDVLRKQILLGEVDNEEALAAIDQLIGGVIGRRRAAFEALPKPPGHSL